MSRTVARELAQFGITVNTYAPGIVRTPLMETLAEETAAAAGQPEEWGWEQFTTDIPLERLAEADDVAYVISFLAVSAPESPPDQWHLERQSRDRGSTHCLTPRSRSLPADHAMSVYRHLHIGGKDGDEQGRRGHCGRLAGLRDEQARSTEKLCHPGSVDQLALARQRRRHDRLEDLRTHTVDHPRDEEGTDEHLGTCGKRPHGRNYRIRATSPGECHV